MTTTKLWMTTLLLSAAGVAAAGAGAPGPADEPAPEQKDAFGDPLPPGALARMGTVRLRHDGAVCCVAFSPDGRLLASSSAQGQLRLWDPRTGQLVRRLLDPSGAVYAIAFSPDGKMLATSSTDTTSLVWDLTGRRRGGRRETAVLPPDALDAAWKALAGDDAQEAYRAVWALAAAPDQTTPLLKERLRATPPINPKETARRIADLDSDDFDVREKANGDLDKMGDLAEPALRKALAEQPSPEARRRVERLLTKLEGPVASPERLQQLRSLEVLEQISTAPAERVLEEIAQGAPESRLTREAKTSLERLARRRPTAP